MAFGMGVNFVSLYATEHHVRSRVTSRRVDGQEEMVKILLPLYTRHLEMLH